MAETDQRAIVMVVLGIPMFVSTVVVIGAVALATLAVGAWLFVRWRLVVQVCILGGDA